MRAAVASIVLLALPARAEPPATIEVDRAAGAESCPDATRLAQRVAELEPNAELSPATDERAGTHLQVSLERRPQHWRAEIVLSGARSGQRTLTDSGPTCAGLGEAVALTLAMLLEPEPAAPAPSPPPASLAPPDPAPTPPAVVAAAAREPKPELGVAVSAGPALHVGLLARAGVAAEARVELESGSSLTTSVGALWAPRQRIEHGEGHVDVSLAALVVFGCLDLLGEPQTIELSACAAQAAGQLRGAGSGYSAYTDSVGRPWLAIGAAVRADGVISGPLGWNAGLTGWTPILRERFAVEGVAGIAFEPPPVAMVAGAGLGLSIW